MIKSLYIHIPFCDDICGYCDFVRVGYNDKLSDLYLVELRKDLLSLSTQYKTIYLGGGTPSSLSVQQFSFLLESMNHLVGLVDEFTIEVNPDSLTIEKAKLYQQAGINRVSLGVQTTNNQLLKKIGRTHTFEDVKKSIELLKFVGISNISMDLIYGLPTQKLDDLESDLNKLLSLSPTHLSLYSLTIEPNSQFSRAGIKEVSSELETEMYLLIQEKLIKHGFIHYEISNYCLLGYESIHNLSYWKYDDYLGIGVGASSKVNHRRFTNHHNIND
ncbi:MAG: radical SAM family heme chaperone HemW [Erysipelothrix sp.]|nr:radical SAM family heme chaperone HemW [Erysipelothrix sp.]